MSRNLIQFLTARICTIFAFQMQVVAIGWQMYSLTNSAMDLGLIGLAQYVPAMLLTLLAGHAADHYDRRLIAIGSQLVMAVMMLMLAWGSWHHTLTRETMFVLVVIIGSAKAFESPAMSSLLPALVPIETLPRAISSWARVRDLVIRANQSH